MLEFDRRHAEAMRANESEVGQRYGPVFYQSEVVKHLFPQMEAQCPDPVSFEVVGYVSTAGRVENALVRPEGPETACRLKVITSMQGLPPPPREFWGKGFPFVIGQEVNGKPAAPPMDRR